jgi:hypothetical protein
VALLAVASIAVAPLGGGASQAAAKAPAQSFEVLLGAKIAKKAGNRVAAAGSATGTVAGTASVRFILVNSSKATIWFSGEDAHGTLSGTGVAKYYVSGAVSTYTGKITKLEGTGRYAHAASHGISFSGTVNRLTYKVKASLSGQWSF